MSPTIIFIWITSASKGADFVLQGGDNSFVIDIGALGVFGSLDTSKDMERVVTNHQYLPALHDDRTMAHMVKTLRESLLLMI